MDSISMGLFVIKMRLFCETETVFQFSHQVHDREWRTGLYEAGVENRDWSEVEKENDVCCELGLIDAWYPGFVDY